MMEAPVRTAPSELSRVLEEVEQYMSLGFVDDARDALREISARYPGEPAIADAVERLGLDLDVPEDVPAFEEVEEPVFAVADDGSDIEIPEQIEPPPPAPIVDEEDVLAGLGVETAPPPIGSELGLETDMPAVEDDFDVDADLEKAVAEASEAAHALEDGPVVAEEPADEEEPVFAAAPEIEPPVALPERGGRVVLGAPTAGSTWAPSWGPVRRAVGGGRGAGLGLQRRAGASGLADIFKEFKKGVDKQLGQEDYDTRYNLGIAYKEMGLIDEAIAEFQLAARTRGRLLECSSMLGICFMDKGMPKLAIEVVREGTEGARPA